MYDTKYISSIKNLKKSLYLFKEVLVNLEDNKIDTNLVNDIKICIQEIRDNCNFD